MKGQIHKSIFWRRMKMANKKEMKHKPETEIKEAEIETEKDTEKSEVSALQEMRELLQRTQANFENYRKQQEKRIEALREMAAKDIILQLLPVLDNFELALKNVDAQDTQNTPEFIKGVELIYSQLFSLLENNGVKVIKTENKKFDPYFHEALMKVESELQEGMVVEELQKGYLLNGKVVRHAKVKISKGSDLNVDKNKKSMKSGEVSSECVESEGSNDKDGE